MTIACVVAAVDGSPESLRAVDWAADDAFRRGLGLRLVHACLWERYEQETLDDSELAPERKAVQEILDSAGERAVKRRPGVPVETELLAEDVLSALLGLQRHSPLLVLGTRGHGGFPGLLLGSVALRVTARAAYPVVVVRGEGAPAEPGHRRVVLGVGPHDVSAAVDLAVEEAVAGHADLELVHAWHPDVDLSGMSVLMDVGAASDRARSLLNAVRLPDLGDTEVEVRRKAEQARPAPALLRAAAGADLLVVGAHRRRGHPGLQLGSVNHAMLHHAPCPVAVVPTL
ncbi:universal stress protein [Streptomyces sp. RKAG337]|uniref:universal stress protein n=1 Tax=Streptomyces sp. RKAG337 TaxID=2893404 RepID=UPI0020338D0F|nr:universal stress protein [Streptomyces sp. RKAG337]MCM2430092.1 universal stress protein [Streptomyces sp. RKAG337]